MGVVRSLIEDLDAHDSVVTEIPLSNVSTQELKWVIEYLTIQKTHPAGTDAYVIAKVCPRARIVDPEHSLRLVRFTAAVMYLDVPTLLTACCTRIAHILHGKTEEEIRTQFGITCEFMDSQRRAAKSAPSWVGESFAE
jgi:S-phase kinase-associated protein 1